MTPEEIPELLRFIVILPVFFKSAAIAAAAGVSPANLQSACSIYPEFTRRGEQRGLRCSHGAVTVKDG
jgi:hypothetical protein